MKKPLFLLVAVMAVGCGKSQLDRRAELEAEEQSGGSGTASEELESSEEGVQASAESPQAPEARRGPGEGAGQARSGQQGRRSGGGFGRSNPYASLELTEEQQEKIAAIQAAQRAETSQLFQELRGGGGDREAMGAKMTALREKYQKQIDAILTEDQKKKVAEARAQRPQGGQSGRGERGGRGQGSRQFADLGVNEAQQKNLNTAREELSSEMRTLFLDRNISREEREPKIAQVREAYEAKIKGILSEEQFQKFKEGQSARGSRGQGQGRGPGQGGAQGQGRSPGQGDGRPQPRKIE